MVERLLKRVTHQEMPVRGRAAYQLGQLFGAAFLMLPTNRGLLTVRNRKLNEVRGE